MIVTAGHLAFDYIFLAKTISAANTTAKVDEWGEYFGGGAANIAAAVAKLGGRAGLFAFVGPDFKGSKYEKELKKIGVSFSFLNYKDEGTPRTWMYSDYSDQHQCYIYWGASKHLRESSVPKLKKGDILHFAAGDPQFVVKNAEGVKCEISFDPAHDTYLFTKEDLMKILPRVDYFFANEHEIKLVQEITDLSIDAICRKVGALIVSEGRNGSTLYTKGKRKHFSAFKASVKDTVGAGDGHRAGFLFARQKGYSLEESVKIGNAVASFVVQEAGAQPGQPTWQQVKKRLGGSA